MSFVWQGTRVGRCACRMRVICSEQLKAGQARPCSGCIEYDQGEPSARLSHAHTRTQGDAYRTSTGFPYTSFLLLGRPWRKGVSRLDACLRPSCLLRLIPFADNPSLQRGQGAKPMYTDLLRIDKDGGCLKRVKSESDEGAYIGRKSSYI